MKRKSLLESSLPLSFSFEPVVSGSWSGRTGRVALVHSKTTKRANWPLAAVTPSSPCTGGLVRVARDGATVRSVGKPSVHTTSHVIYGRTKSTAPPRRPASPVRPLRRRVPAQRRRRHSVAMPRLSFLWRERAWVGRWSCYAWKCLERSPSTGRDDASLVLLSGPAIGRVREPLRCQGGPE